jgi:hypothetical protein
LGYFGPTYNAAKAATIAPAYFVRGLPKTPKELGNHQTSSKINAGIDIILNHMMKDQVNKVPIGKKAKFTIHCDSRQAEPAVLFVRTTTLSGTSCADVRNWSVEVSVPDFMMEVSPNPNEEGLRWR